MLSEHDTALKDFSDSLRGTFSGSCRPRLGEPMRAPAAPDDGLGEAAALGGLAIGLAADVGGIPDAAGEFSVFHAELARALISAPVTGSAVLAGQLLDRGAKDAVRAAVLPRVVAGKLVIAAAPLGSRMGSFTATGDGSGWRVSGRAKMVLGLPQAELVLLLAEAAGRPALFLADRCVLPPIQAYRLIDGRSAGDLELSGLELDASALVGTGEALDEAVAQARSAFILALASEALGAMERALELTAGYMNMREQFGQPIARFQALQHSLAEMACDVEMSRSLVGMVVEQTAREGGERDMAIAMAAIRIPRDAVRVCERAIQIHGGIGITEEYEAGHHYRRALTIQGLMNAVKPSATEIIERQAAMTALDAA